ncbi:MAG: lipoprotein signal peptidase [Saprospiraceae bacterium]|nr:lipoprotein signal peptidase [Saprospiraceae bacterium]
MKRKYWISVVVFLVLLIDQSIKIWVKTHMNYGDEIKILGLEWALIHFVENPGMAFGITLGKGVIGKYALSIFRILAVFFLVYFINELIRKNMPKGLLFSFALILAGAIGNILDSAFYGLIFSDSPYHGGLAQFLPENGGYAGFLQGRVVDMFYFPVFRGIWPEWVPFVGGQFYLFFKPVFNVADVSISIGVLNVLVFQRRYFLSELERIEVEAEKATLDNQKEEE